MNTFINNHPVRWIQSLRIAFIESIRLIGLIALCLISLNVQAQAEEIIFYHYDGTNSPVAATDMNGNVVWQERREPFGAPKLNHPEKQNHSVDYTGHVYDKRLGLMYMGRRFYDPKIGRFISADPIGFTPSNVQSFNRYAYANNNPYKYWDPDGRFAHALVGLGAVMLGYTAITGGITGANTMETPMHSPSQINGLGTSLPASSFDRSKATLGGYQQEVSLGSGGFLGGFQAWTSSVWDSIFLSSGNNGMLGTNGVKIESITIWKDKSGRGRLDVENPAPGVRPGQIHYHDDKGTKHIYDPQSDSFPSMANKQSAKLFNDKDFYNSLHSKGMSKYLGE